MLAQRFGVGVGAVCGWLTMARNEGRRGPRPHGGGRRALGGADPRVLATLVAERGDLSLTGHARRLAGRTGTAPLSTAAIRRALARLGPRRKGKPLHASERDRADVVAARPAWRPRVRAGMDPSGLVSLGESGVDTAMAPTCARAPRGTRAVGHGLRPSPGGTAREAG